MHDLFTVGLPLLAILAGILFNRADVKELRQEIKQLRAEVRGEMHELRTEVRGEIREVRGEIRELRGEINKRFDEVDAELRYFHGTQGEHKARIEALEKR